jgi:4-amino-4-deoxy-L-arabinose transferase-like glycosyltransferase
VEGVPVSLDRRRVTLAWAAAVLLAVVFLAQSWGASLHHSLTWDEPSFISAGYAYLTRGEFRVNASHPPLLQALEAAPLLAMGLNVPPGPYELGWDRYPNPIVAFSQQFLFGSGNDVRVITFWARLPILLLGAALVLAVYAWGRQLYGSYPALLGAALCAVCPNLIAHAGLATEDLGCTALVFTAAWTYWLAYRHGAGWRWGRCGLFTGLALVSKYTALVLGPAYLIIAAVCLVARIGPLSARGWIRGLTTIGVVAAAVVAAAYGPRLGWTWYVRGLRLIYSDVRPGQLWYLAGTFSPEPHWYYALAAFAFKVSGGTLLLLAWSWASVARSDGDREDVLFVLLPAGAVVVASFFDSGNFGLRRILPAFPFLFLFASRIAARLGGRRRVVTIAVAVALVGWSGIEAALIYPDHLSYFSALVGGPEAGPELLDDSNIDWGQDLPALAAWQRAHPEAGELRIAYFGSAHPETYGVKARALESEAEILQPAPGTYAMSVHALIRFRERVPALGPAMDWLARYRPTARAGRSIYIYRFE